MVEMMKPASKSRNVKLEIVEDFLEEEHAPLNKRSRLWSTGISGSLVLLDEPSPLGLSLRKTPSLQDLIQTRLSQNDVPKSETKAIAPPALGAVEKLKASNFPASLLRIGQWEYKSRYEGDLVAKCYFAKHKLVWEVLQQGLKSKIEIQWSDIMALKANCPEDEPGTLIILLARQPLFFRETNPQPRKHTLWQATSDFTDGQASKNRQHFLQCSQGILNKHFEKLVQCDHRLFHLSRQPEINMESPYFDARQSIFEELDESKSHIFEQLAESQNMASPVGAQSSSEHMSLSHEALSPSSVMDAHAIEGVGASRNTADWSKIQVPGLHQSISMSDFLSLLSDQACGNNPEFEEMKEVLLSDNQTETSDEKSVMTKVNSFYNLLQAAANSQLNEEISNAEWNRVVDPASAPASASSNKPQGMSRKDSFSDLMVHLPRITSLPKFLFNISEEDGDAA